MPKCSMPPGSGAGLVDFDLVAEPRQMDRPRTGRSARRRRPVRACRSAGRRLGRVQPSRGREIAEEAFDGVDADGAVELRRGCRRFRRGDSRPGHAPPASDCRASAAPRPRGTFPACAKPSQPGYPRRPGRRVAGRQQVDIDRSACEPAPGPRSRVRSTGGLISRATMFIWLLPWSEQPERRVRPPPCDGTPVPVSG